MRKRSWKLLLILGTLILMTCAGCSRHSVQAAYPKPTQKAQKVTDFCEDAYPAEGEVLEPKKCPPIECDLVFTPERCSNAGN